MCWNNGSIEILKQFLVELIKPLINCEINLILTWHAHCVIVSTAFANEGAIFSIIDRKPYVPVVTLSTQDNAKLLQQLKSGFKTKIYWNNYQSNVKPYTGRKP